MRPDIIALRGFYGTRLGKWVRGRLAHEVMQRWPELREDVVLGIGYATPVLRFLIRGVGPGGSVVAAMPRSQGGIYWPSRGDNRTILTHKQALPFTANSIHRAVLLHALEFAEDAKGSLKELCRVMTPGGRVIIVVPHRRSIWSSAGGTPFGYGTPYSVSQLKHLLEDTGLTVMQHETLLHTPPFQSKLMLRMARIFEGIGMLLPFTGGLILLEAEKQIYAGVRETKRKATASTVWIPAEAPTSSMQRDR